MNTSTIGAGGDGDGAADPAVTHDPPRSRSQRLGFPPGLRPWRESLLVVAVVAPLLTVTYRLWDAHLRVPFSTRGDSLATAAYVKAILERGWYFSNPRLGAPFVADWHDYPVGGENLHWLGHKLLAMATGSYGLALNLYFLLGFFLIALSAYFVARYLRRSVPVALVVGVLYAFLPYHAFRGSLGQLARASYYLLPLVMLVLLWAADYRHELLLTTGDRTRWRRGRVGFAVLVAMLLGASDTQNVAYLVAFLGLFALVQTVRDRTWRPLAFAALVGLVAMGALTLNNAPYLLHRGAHGPNTSLAKRALSEQDVYALRPVSLVLPAPGHRIGFLADLADDAARGQRTDGESGGTPLGLVGSFGLVISIGAVGAGALGGRRRSRTAEDLARLGAVNLVAILVGSVGGIAYLLAVAGFTQYRTWNRVSLFIAFASLLATGIVLDRALEWLRGRRLGTTAFRTVVGVTTAILLIGGALDQITPAEVPDYAAVAAQYDRDASFFHTLERRLPHDATVFDLPLMPFPENGPVVSLPDYAEFAGYLHTDHLRWSYGGMKGRPEADWLTNLAGCDHRALVSEIAAAGFRGAVIDRRGYPDGGAGFLAAVEPLVGSPGLRSDDDHLLYLDLTGLRSRLETRLGTDAVRRWGQDLLGMRMTWDGAPLEGTCGDTVRWATRPTVTVAIANRTASPRPVSVVTDLVANTAASHITVRGRGWKVEVPLVNGAAHFERRFTVRPGTTELRFTVVGPPASVTADGGTRWFGFVNPTIEPASTRDALMVVSGAG